MAKRNMAANVGCGAELWKMADAALGAALLPQVVSGELRVNDLRPSCEVLS